MPLQFFTISIQDNGEASDALNQFLRSHKIIDTERHFVDNGSSSLWSVCISYQDGEGRPQPSKKSKIDYREVLNEQDFTVFSRIRTLRKELSDRDRVPPYALFSNEQLADMVRRRVTSLSALAEIDGVGEARVKKYGQAFVTALQASFASLSQAPDQGAEQ
jgi:superfamily II DNA helicase RecQ